MLVGSTAQVAIALFNATRETAIVMTTITDPIALGTRAAAFRTQLATSQASPFSACRLQLSNLKYCTRLCRRAARSPLSEGQNPSGALFKSRVQEAADELGIKLVSLPLTSEAEIAGAFARVDQERVTAVLVEAGPVTYRLSGRIVDQCLIRDLPAMHSWPIEVRNGALMSYGPAEPENNAHAAIYVDRILKGARVAQLPFEEPTEIKLVINLRTARSIGITLSPALLTRADEVIE